MCSRVTIAVYDRLYHIDYYRDTATHDKLIFSSTITHILTHMHITILPSPHFYVMGAISKESIRRSAA